MRMTTRPAFHGPSLVTVSAKGTVVVKEIGFSMRQRLQNRMSAILCAYHSSLRSRRLHCSMKLSHPAYLEGSEEEDKSVLVDGQRPTLKEVCNGLVPQNLLDRAQELGFEFSTQTQVEALPVVMAGGDCLLQAQTGSGKTLAYLLPLLAKVAPRSAVQGIVVVPTRELGMQVAKVARALVGKASNTEEEHFAEREGFISVMTLLDGGSVARQKRWIKAAPPQVVVGTLRCLSRLIDSHHLKTRAVETLVIDEVDTMLGSAKEGDLLHKLLTVHTQAEQRQTIFASATVPQHNRFIRDCVQKKWAKDDLFHIHVSPEVIMPTYLEHRYVVCDKQDKLQVLASILNIDNPRSAVIFVNESGKSKRLGEPSNTITTAEFLSEKVKKGMVGSGDSDQWQPLVLEDTDHINERTFILSNFRSGRRLLVATDLAARGLDLPDVSHIYNVDCPSNVIIYIHRAGRTGRKPISLERGTVTSFVIPKELFVLQRIENESRTKFLPLQVNTEP